MDVDHELTIYLRRKSRNRHVVLGVVMKHSGVGILCSSTEPAAKAADEDHDDPDLYLV